MPQTEEVVTQNKDSQQGDEISSVHGKPSTELLLPKQVAMKQEVSKVLQPVMETASNRTSMYSTHLLGTTAAAAAVPPVANSQEKNGISHSQVQTAKQQTRNWEHFPGKTKYHLNGRVQFGTQYFANIGTTTLILVPTALYFAFTYVSLEIGLIDRGRYLWTEYSPALPISFAYLVLLCLSSLIKASTSDPGVSSLPFFVDK